MRTKFFLNAIKLIKTRHRILLKTAIFTVALIYFSSNILASQIKTAYKKSGSPVITDRNGDIIEIKRNEKGNYAQKLGDVPVKFEKFLLKKEDKLFYYHPGINPASIIRNAISYFTTGKLRGSSTLSQQLVKILLGNENNRTISNKIQEALYALSLEAHSSKDEILAMYADTAYFGNQAQGLGYASRYYFGKDPEALTDAEILSLLAALNNPASRFPGSRENKEFIPYLAGFLNTDINDALPAADMDLRSRAPRNTKTAFEINSLGMDCTGTCALTVDSRLTENIRGILKRNLALPSLADTDNGAVVIIKLPENELLAIVGSPDPESLSPGSQINMALEARPIGSTAKPFIYANAFEKGARPYSLVEDREYAYQIGTGFTFYPKNYDGNYRGTVTLHEALSNSLNVPSVKVLEFAGLEKIYKFFRDSLGFKPIQPLENYELGIALGALEMDLLTLSHYFTIFPNEGVLKPLRIKTDEPGSLTAPMGSELKEEKRVIQKEFTELINKILSDRETSIDQFGMRSSLTLNHKNYALKTGTSRDYHDSWTVGYTPDFLVGVWLGNSDNTPTQKISGQMGAGKVWHEAMEIMLNSPYNRNTPFDLGLVEEFTGSGSIEYGLKNDDYETARHLLEKPPLILHPHDGDSFLLGKNTVIPFTASETADWYINGSFYGSGKELSWKPIRDGKYEIRAEDRVSKKEMRIEIRISEDE